MGKLEKYFTIFAFGFFVCSIFVGVYLSCLPMHLFSVMFAAMSGFAAIFDGGNK